MNKNTPVKNPFSIKSTNKVVFLTKNQWFARAEIAKFK